MKRPVANVSALPALAEILAPGAIGLFVVGKTLLFYLGKDGTAAMLVIAMGVGLVFGLLELVGRSRRANSLASEVAGLGPTLDEDGLLGLSPTLRDILRARLEQAPFTWRAESVTPFLVGLMVMLGLLGTLLGLFETLSGAGHALTASANVEALRSGLSGPMRGLTRSFGCSAAGVSASAMLGLAAALVRKREADALSHVYSYANGPLRALSPVRSQLAALHQLSEQGHALPKAASALEQASQQLVGLAGSWESAHLGLAERWEKAHQQASEAQQRGLAQALTSMRAELAKAAAEAGKVIQASLGQQVEQMVRKTSDAVAAHMAETVRVLDRDLSAKREADGAVRAQVEQLVKSASDAVSTQMADTARVLEQDLTAKREADAGLRALVGEQLSTLRAELSKAAAAQSELLTGQAGVVEKALLQAVAQQGAQLATQREQAEAHMAALGESSRALTARLDDDAKARREEAGELFGNLASKLDDAGQNLGHLAEGMGEQLKARLDAESSLAEQSRDAMALLEQSGKALEESLTRHDLAVESLVEHAGQQLVRMGDNAQQSAGVAVARMVELASEQSERLAGLESLLQSSQAQHVQGLSDQLTGHAERLGKGLEGTTGLVHEAAGLLKASSIEMAAVAEMFAKSVERQREAASSWLESLGELEGAVERAGRGAAADALGDQLASTQEVFARQLQFQRELFEQLRTLRAPQPVPVHGEHDVSA